MSYRLDQESLALIFKQVKDNTVQKEDGKGLSTNDYTTDDKNKVANIPSKTSDLTNDSGFITTSDIPEGAAASTTSPKMDGTAAVGTELAFARGDHVHPSDTSRVPTTRKVNGKSLSADITLTAADVGAATAADVAAAKQEAIETVLGAGEISEDFDTLKEVAAWIQSDTTESAELINRVTAIENNYVKEDDITALTEAEVEEAWASV